MTKIAVKVYESLPPTLKFGEFKTNGVELYEWRGQPVEFIGGEPYVSYYA